MRNIKICSMTPLQNRIAESREKLYRVALAWCGDEMLADDLVQETIAAGMKNYKQLRDENCMFSWICRIMRNNWYRYLSKQKNHDGIDEQYPSNDSGPFTNCQQIDIVKQVRQAVDELSIEQRQIISLVDLGELSYCEVAQILDIPVGTVMSRLHRARKSLLKKLEKNQQPSIPVTRCMQIVEK
ncbi:MAG: RNA polymerase sigma factor [Gammaproteobacteria bacterium]|nr:RNA polymerase sigma factor [Gammaproteobacteria bacterium]